MDSPEKTRISVVPANGAVMSRRELRDNPTEWPVVGETVAALRLAADGSPRSREVLDGWRFVDRLRSLHG